MNRFAFDYLAAHGYICLSLLMHQAQKRRLQVLEASGPSKHLASEPAPITNTDVYMTSREAAEYRRLADVTLRLERQQGRGPAYVKLGHRVFYRKLDIDNYMRAHTVEPRKSSAA